jgi:hypothetical protein
MFFKKGSNTILICFYQQELILCLIKKEVAQSPKPFNLNDYQRTTLKQTINQGLSQPEEVVGAIADFARKNSLRTYTLAMCLNPCWADENFVEQDTQNCSTPDANSPHIQTQQVCLGVATQSYIYYQCRVASPLIFQLHMIGIKLKKEIIAITTMQWSFFWLIKKIYGTAFRVEQVTQYLQKKQILFRAHAGTEIVNRLLFNKHLFDISAETVFLLACIGFTYAKEQYE